MSLKRPVTIAQARQWPAAAARRKSFCARMGGMREQLTSERTARDPRSRINRALAAWDCDEPELLQRKHVSKGIRPMKITSKMVGAEARKNPAANEPMYVHAHLGSGKVEFYKAMVPQFAAGGPKKAADQVAVRLGFPIFVGSRSAGSTDDGLPMYRFEYVNEEATHAILLYVRSMPLEGARYKAVKTVSKNPARKPTVSRKISQLTREGYPQRQAVAIALSEQRAGKVRKNPPKAKMWAVVKIGARSPLAVFATRADAVAFGQSWADIHKAPVQVIAA